MEEPQAPGLRWRVTRAGRTPIWRASKAAVIAGYPVKSANLAVFADDARMLAQRCQRLQAEMTEWMSGRRDRPMNFDGTFASLISIYQRDPESPYQKLKPSSRHPYDVYCRMLTLEIGARLSMPATVAMRAAGLRHGASRPSPAADHVSPLREWR